MCWNIKELLDWVVKSGILKHCSPVIIWDEMVNYKRAVGDALTTKLDENPSQLTPGLWSLLQINLNTD